MMARGATDVLIFVEDPGAANYVAPLPAALAQEGRCARLLSCGSATNYLGNRGDIHEFLPADMTAAEILAESKPAVMVVGTSENKKTRAFEFVSEARTSHIPSIGVVDGPACIDFRFRGEGTSPIEHAPDTVIVADTATMEGLVRLGLAQQRVLLCGHPHFDKVRETAEALSRRDKDTLRKKICPKAPADRPLITLLAEQEDGLDPSGYRLDGTYSLTGRGASNRRVDIVIEEFLDAVAMLPKRPFLVLRLHPKNSREEFSQYLSEFDLISQGGSPLELVWVSDKVVGLTSILLAEAVLLGTPTLSIVPREIERSWLVTSAAGITPCATTTQEVRRHILGENSSPILASDVENAMPEGATKRVVAEIARLGGWQTESRAPSA